MIRKSLSPGLRLLKTTRQFATAASNRTPNAFFHQRKVTVNFLRNKMGCSTSKVEISRSSSTTQQETCDDFVEDVVCQVSDLNEDEPKTFDLDEGKVLLIKQDGKINALGTKCTHYGAPLVSSAVGKGRLRCQWHGACFNLATGDIEDFPGLDSLPCYKVTIEDNNVKVRARKADLEANKRVKPMVKRYKQEQQSIVVIGGGPAGATCVEALRQEGYTGQLTLVCRENYLPYDRVKVSKAMDFEIEKAQFRDDKFYSEYGIDVLKGIEATAVNSCEGSVTLSNGDKLKYDKLFIATGCKARKLNIPGADLQDVVVLRDYDHSRYTNAQLTEDKEVVVLGSSFIAMEAANYCVNKVKKVTVILRDNLPFKYTLGEEIGCAFSQLFKDKGVHFLPYSGLTKINSNSNGKIVSVEVKDGSQLKADLVIMGVGSTYYTDFLKNSGIDIREDGTIETNEYLQTNVPNVYVGGDIAYAPVWSHNSQKSAIGHYPLAHYHGKIAALNMLGKQTKMEAVPYFWTMLFGKGVRYAGHGNFDDIIYAGNVQEFKFVAFYLKDDEVVAASSCGMDPIVSKFAELLSQGKKLHRNEIKSDPLAWTRK